MTEPTRYRLERGGILNVWQYDRQVFELAEGRLLLRGANGAGKSKTMEMLLPFAIDGDKARLTASGRHHTSLLWLMLDGYDGQARTGYVWVEFSRAVENGPPETLTFGVGIRATQSARAATAWYFTSSRRVGADLVLEDDAGPLSRQQLEAALEEDPAGQVFEQAARYREHVGRLLFGLPGDQYDDLLRLIYWLRQPQVGEDIDPKRLAEQLVNALPQLDDDALRSAGSTFDELEAYGEQIEGRARAAEALGRFAEVYRGYAGAVLAEHARAVLDAEARLRSATTEQRRVEAELSSVRDSLTEVTRQESAAQADAEAVAHTIRALESGPEARARATLLEMGERVKVLQARADDSAGHRDRAGERADGRAAQAQQDAGTLGQHLTTLDAAVDDVARRLVDGGVGAPTGALEALAVLRNPDLRLRWDSAEPGQGLAQALRATADWLTGADGAAVRRQAAVGVVLEALTAVTEARRAADAQGAREGEAQVRADEASRRRDEARDALAQEEEAFGDAVSRWWRERLDAEPPALDLDGIGALGALARDAVDDETQQLTAEVGRAGAERDTARTLAADLERRRDEVAGQVDPLPEAPPWSRDPRGDRPGAPFWQLVDFSDDLDATRRAGLEAALEGAGVLDAWVFPDGHVDGDLLDVQLGHASSSAAAVSNTGRMPGRPGTLSAPTLSAVLRPDLGDGSSGVGEDVVRGLLDRIGILPLEDSERGVGGRRPGPRSGGCRRRSRRTRHPRPCRGTRCPRLRRRTLAGRPAPRPHHEGGRPVHRGRGSRRRAAAPARRARRPDRRGATAGSVRRGSAPGRAVRARRHPVVAVVTAEPRRAAACVEHRAGEGVRPGLCRGRPVPGGRRRPVRAR